MSTQLVDPSADSWTLQVAEPPPDHRKSHHRTQKPVGLTASPFAAPASTDADSNDHNTNIRLQSLAT